MRNEEDKFIDIVEVAGDIASQEQIERLCNRYYWAGKYCRNKDVVETACGTGQGLAYLSGVSKSLHAGDYSEKILKIARNHYKDRINFQRFDAQNMPFPDNSLDVVVLFEAIYYLPSPEKFVGECHRILRKGGVVLISTANKDLYDFNPSPYSRRYFGTVELNELFTGHGFSIECFGDVSMKMISFRQKIFRPIKAASVKLNIIPKSMDGKKLLKRLIFGKMTKMPLEITEDIITYREPSRISILEPNREHKVIYCVANME